MEGHIAIYPLGVSGVEEKTYESNYPVLGCHCTVSARQVTCLMPVEFCGEMVEKQGVPPYGIL